ncbi:hypothetical protein SAMN05216559_0652 [Halomicrobium zhouii]|uniref:Uncharacterized protein n=1 Tax=Halomicrobium zhouii TaxID=767519 RepID=A0A1I6KEB4_9EURY|nr:hypothetical protein [Halomicrobium zhouii]SFR89572.1 hypothetical protein SAMN05216559_0652 [Halomicrobium zhouii]
MSDDVFTDPDDADRSPSENGTDRPDDEWVDIRMTDPAAGEWNLDAVVVDGRVEYVDLQVRPDVLADFVDCLVDDVSAERAREILERVAAKQDVELASERAEK